MLGKIEGRQRMRWLEVIIDSMDMNFSKLWEIVKDREAWHAAVPGIAELDNNNMKSIWTLDSSRSGFKFELLLFNG